MNVRELPDATKPGCYVERLSQHTPRWDNVKRILSALSVAALLLGGLPVAQAQAAGGTDSRIGPPLSYHGGPIVTKAKNYLVFWTGGNRKAFDPRYVSLLQQWQKDARHITVFKATTQYGQKNGKRPADTSYAGTYYNHTPFPNNAACQNKCVVDTDIARVAAQTVKANKIPVGLDSIVYVYTPQGVRRCSRFVDADTECAEERNGRDYYGHCGARSTLPVGKAKLNLVFVNYPTLWCYNDDQDQRYPNWLWADAAVNITANFQMEAITNPLGDAWYAVMGDNWYEVASSCRGKFGPTLPGKRGNSHYNGRTYDVQAMASNREQGCVVGSRTDGF